MNEQVPAPGGFDFNKPTIVALLYIASPLVGLTALAGLVMAYVWQGEAAVTWEQSHFRFHIRTFWIGLTIGLVGLAVTFLTMGLAGFIIYPLLALWFAVRTIKALLGAQKREAIANIESWLW